MRFSRQGRLYRPSRKLRRSAVAGGGGGGAAIEYIGSWENAYAGAGTLAFPAGYADGDLVIVFGVDRANNNPAFLQGTKIGAGAGGFFQAFQFIIAGDTSIAHIGGNGTTIGCQVYRNADPAGITATFGQFGTTAGFTSSMEFPSIAASADGFNGWAFSRLNDTPSTVAWTVTPDDSGTRDTAAGNDSGTQHAVLAGDGTAKAQQNDGNYQAFFTEGFTYTLEPV